MLLKFALEEINGAFGLSFFFIFGSLRNDEIFVMLVVPLLDGEF